MSWIFSIFTYKLDLMVNKKNPKFFDLVTYGLQDMAHLSLKIGQIFEGFFSIFLKVIFKAVKKYEILTSN